MDRNGNWDRMEWDRIHFVRSNPDSDLLNPFLSN